MLGWARPSFTDQSAVRSESRGVPVSSPVRWGRRACAKIWSEIEASLRTPSKKTCPSNWRCRHLDRCIACLTAGLWVYILKVRFIVYSLLQEVMHCTNWMSGPSPDILCTNGVARMHRSRGLLAFFFACVCVWYLVSLATPFPERGLPATTELSPRNAIIEHSNKMLISSFCRRGNLMVAAWPDPPSLCEGCGLGGYMISPWTFCQYVKFYLLNLCTSILKVSKHG